MSYAKTVSSGRTQSKNNYQSKARVLFDGDSVAHNVEFRKLEIVTNTTIKTAKAYSSAFDKDAKFTSKNVKDVVKNELGKANFDKLVLASPTVDISNLDTTKMTPSDDTGSMKQRIMSSCKNMFNIAQYALAGNFGIKNVTIMDHAPRK